MVKKRKNGRPLGRKPASTVTKMPSTSGTVRHLISVSRRRVDVAKRSSPYSNHFKPTVRVDHQKSPGGRAEGELQPEDRLPIRFRKVTKLGEEIVRKIGRFDNFLDGCRLVANLGPYRLVYHTWFNPPAGQRSPHWSGRKVQQFELIISDNRGPVCLDVVWTNCNTQFLRTRDPEGNNWDRHLRKLWAKHLRRTAVKRP